MQNNDLRFLISSRINVKNLVNQKSLIVVRK